MSDITLKPIRSGYNLSKINQNFETIEDVINDEVLHTTGGNNTMNQQLDMDSNKMINLPEPTSDTEPVRRIDLIEYADEASQATLGNHELRIDSLETYSGTLSFNTLSEAKLYSDYKVGDLVKIKGRPSLYTVIPSSIGTPDDGVYIDLDNFSGQLEVIIEEDLWVEQWGVVFDDSTDNTQQLQRAINFCANNNITKLRAGSGVARYSTLYFTYHPTNNPDFPSGVREGWGFSIIGQNRLYTEDVSQIEIEVLLSPATIFRSTVSSGIPLQLTVNNTSTIQAGVQFKDCAFIADNNDWMLEFSATPQSKLFDNISFHQKHVNGSGVIVEDLWISTWGDVLISGQDTTGIQTGSGLVLRNRLFSGGGMWKFGNINVRGFKNSGSLGYMTDNGDDIKLLDSLVIDVLQCRNSENGIKLGGKMRSAVISGYHTEGCTVTGMQIAAEAGSVLILSSYWDCALCSNASLVLGSGTGSVTAGLNEKSWSEVELRCFNFIDTNVCGIKIVDGTFGENLVLATGKIGKVSGAGTLGIDFDNFEGNLRLSNVRYVGLTSNIANTPQAVKYVDEGNFECYRSSLVVFQKREVNVEALTATKFLSGSDPEVQVISPDATNSRVVLPNTNTQRSFKFKNNSGSFNLNIRDNSNTTTLLTLAPSESSEFFSDGSSWYSL